MLTVLQRQFAHYRTERNVFFDERMHPRLLELRGKLPLPLGAPKLSQAPEPLFQRQEGDRRRLRQGRRRQVPGDEPARLRDAAPRLPLRRARRGHHRPLDPEVLRYHAARDGHRPVPAPRDHPYRAAAHVHQPHSRERDRARGLARPRDRRRGYPVLDGRALAGCGLYVRRPASRHRRRAADRVPVPAHRRRGHRHHPAGSREHDRGEGREHGGHDERARARRCGEHELLPLPQLRREAPDLRREQGRADR